MMIFTFAFACNMQDEKEMAPYYQRNTPPYPGDKAGVEDFMERGGSLNTVLPPRPGRAKEMRQNLITALHEDRVNRESQKLWLRMRREAERELSAQGYSVE